MSVLDQMKQAAKEAVEAGGRAAAAAVDKAGEAAAAGVEKAAVVARDPATHAKAKIVAKGAAEGAGRAGAAAGRGVKSALDKLNPATLAAIVIKATSIQEQANAALRRSKSLYRIGGIEIGAAFPPSISFQIVRAAELELEEEAMGALDEGRIASEDLVAQGVIGEPVDAADLEDSGAESDDGATEEAESA